MDHIIGAGVRGISRTIAITSEAVAGRKDNNVARNTNDDRGDSESDEDVLSREQDLDDAVSDDAVDSEPQAARQADPQLAQDVADTFVSQHEKAIAVPQSVRPLPQSVILPQRRPKHRSRGFIRAYAPILNEYSGIDQATFMDFLTEFDQAAKAWPVFNVINIAAFGIGMVPHAPFVAASIAMNVVATAGAAAQTRYTTNAFLDNINKALFKPRKLCAFIMTYRPDLSDDAILRADITDPQAVAISQILTRDASNSLKQKLSRFRNVSSGTTRHDSLLPEPAPLIYPALDHALLERSPSTVESNPSQPTSSSGSMTPVKSQSMSSIVQDYLDRRAQAEFIAAHPDHKLTSILPPQDKKFVNRFADPNHPVNSGSVFGLLTGGTFDPIARGRVRRASRKAERKGERPLTEVEKHDAYMGREVRGRVTGTPSKNPLGLKKMFGGSVLYLVITNLPEDQPEEAVNKQ